MDPVAGPLGDLLERVSDAFVALDKEWRYTYVNQHAAELFGRQPEDLVGRHIWTVFPEGVGQPFHLAYERAMAEQVFIQMENYYEPWDLLHYSRLDAETPTRTDVDLARLLEAVLTDRKAAIVERHAEVGDNLSVTRVRTWERGLLQTMTNLIDNALKYSRHARPPRIHIGSEQLPDAVRITISDNGIGFDMKYHDRIFGLFNRLVRQEDFEGTGAGLAIVKKVIEKMGGAVRAESMPGSGTTFFVELPNAEQAEPGHE